MQVIPVLDIKAGAVVHARGGDRAHYQPIGSPLAGGSSDPCAIAAGYRSLHLFTSMYVADLDGIAGGKRNTAALSALRASEPDLAILVDDGRRTAADAFELSRAFGVVGVIGSETIDTADALAGSGNRPDIALSLDFRGDAFQGPPALLDRADLWPDLVIVMTLARVGGNAGPDVDRVAAIVARAGRRRVLAAGGVRGIDDVKRLARVGAAGVLVASALHSGSIKAGDLDEIASLYKGS